jgi:hypothetical protein
LGEVVVSIMPMWPLPVVLDFRMMGFRLDGEYRVSVPLCKAAPAGSMTGTMPVMCAPASVHILVAHPNHSYKNHLQRVFPAVLDRRKLLIILVGRGDLNARPPAPKAVFGMARKLPVFKCFGF